MYCKVYCVVQASIQTNFCWAGPAWLNIAYKINKICKIDSLALLQSKRYKVHNSQFNNIMEISTTNKELYKCDAKCFFKWMCRSAMPVNCNCNDDNTFTNCKELNVFDVYG